MSLGRCNRYPAVLSPTRTHWPARLWFLTAWSLLAVQEVVQARLDRMLSLPTLPLLGTELVLRAR